MKKPTAIGWFSGGVTSAVAIKLAQQFFEVDIVFIDTKNEDEDSYRFQMDCERWYKQPIKTISRIRYNQIQEVWRRFVSLNVAHGAICSSELKREVREMYQKTYPADFQLFGFDIDEPKRAKAMRKNYPEINPVFPLLMFGYTKQDCIRILNEAGIEIPNAYKLGFNNNNCLKTGCIQGGIGYWQKMRDEFPEKFDAMAAMEHELTDIKGQPVTMLKDQSKGGGLVFLKPHPRYPELKHIGMMKGRPPKPLTDCNGFCGTNDLVKNETQLEINYELELTPTN